MKHLKYFLTILCSSFTLVILLNTLFIYFHISSLSLTISNILEVFIVCFVIALMTTLLDFIPIMKEHILISTYCVVIGIGCGAEYLLNQRFYWSDLFIEILVLTIVFLCVWFYLYLQDEKFIKEINEKIKKRNQ